MTTKVNTQLAKIQKILVHNHKLVTFLNLGEVNLIALLQLNLKLALLNLQTKLKI